jgi:hypothetical protein
MITGFVAKDANPARSRTMHYRGYAMSAETPTAWASALIRVPDDVQGVARQKTTRLPPRSRISVTDPLAIEWRS